MALITPRYEQILQRFINTVVARSALKDITDSSSFKHVLAAFARGLDQVGFEASKLLDLFDPDKAEGADLDERAAEMQPTGLVRGPATKATGTLVFSRSGTVGTVTVPIGTGAKTGNGIRVVSTAVATIANGNQDSSPAAAVAAVAGAAGNVAPGTLVRFDSKPAGVDSVSNPDSFVGGADAETDDELRARIKAYAKSLSRCPPSALEFLALGVSLPSGERVRFAKAWEDVVNRGEVILYIDDGSGTAESTELVTAEVVSAGMGGGGGDATVGGERFLQLDFAPDVVGSLALTSDAHGLVTEGTDYTLEDAAGRIKLLETSAFYASGAGAAETFTGTYRRYTGLIAAVWKVIYGDPNDRVNFPGARAAGVRVRIRVPTILQQLVEGHVVVADGFVRVDVVDAVKSAIVTYINGLNISGDVLRAEIITAAMEIPGVQNFILTTPAADVPVLDDQLARGVLSNMLVT